MIVAVKLIYFAVLAIAGTYLRAETLLPLGKLDPGLRAPDRGLDLSAVPGESQLAESVGYHAVLMEETKDDPFQILSLVAQHTEQIHIGTSVAIAFARSPFVTAQAAWTAQKISQGRFELGLGSQVRGHIRRRFGMDWYAPGPWMRDYVNAVRAIWHSWQTETPLEFQSERYNLNLNVPLFTPAPITHPKIPIQVAAVNPYMAKVAAEVGDGVRLHPVCSPRYISEVILPAIAPHKSGDFEVCLKPLIATAADDEALAERIAIARQRLAFYCSTPAYKGAFEIFGLNDLCDELAELSKQGDWSALEARIDDDLLHRCVLVARYDQLAASIKERYGQLVQRIEVSIPVNDQADKEILGEVIDELNR